MKDLARKIHRIADQSGGVWGISLKDLQRKERWDWNADKSFAAASVIKIPIMIAVFTVYEQGEFRLNDTLELKREDIVGGAGVLQHMSAGTLLTIYDLVTLMIIQSDNTATNMLIELIGIERIQQTMKDNGLENSRFYNKLMTVPVHRKGSNIITALEMTHMLEKIVMGKVVSEYACQQMISILKKQQIQDCLPGSLPHKTSNIIGVKNDWELAHKTGSIQGIQHDIGIFYCGYRTIIASVLSKNVEDLKVKQAFMDIGFEIYNNLHKT